jgi:hypothetical protein
VNLQRWISHQYYYENESSGLKQLIDQCDLETKPLGWEIKVFTFTNLKDPAQLRASHIIA